MRNWLSLLLQRLIRAELRMIVALGGCDEYAVTLTRNTPRSWADTSYVLDSALRTLMQENPSLAEPLKPDVGAASPAKWWLPRLAAGFAGIRPPLGPYTPRGQ